MSNFYETAQNNYQSLMWPLPEIIPDHVLGIQPQQFIQPAGTNLIGAGAPVSDLNGSSNIMNSTAAAAAAVAGNCDGYNLPHRISTTLPGPMPSGSLSNLFAAFNNRFEPFNISHGAINNQIPQPESLGIPLADISQINPLHGIVHPPTPVSSDPTNLNQLFLGANLFNPAANCVPFAPVNYDAAMNNFNYPGANLNGYYTDITPPNSLSLGRALVDDPTTSISSQSSPQSENFRLTDNFLINHSRRCSNDLHFSPHGAHQHPMHTIMGHNLCNLAEENDGDEQNPPVDEPHPCDWYDPHKGIACTLMFFTPEDLRDHIIHNHVSEVRKAKHFCLWRGCHRRSEAFGSRALLLRHLRMHTDERPYKCEFCPNAYKNTTGYNVHVRTHTGEVPYECEQCGQLFTTRSNQQRHINTVHALIKKPKKKPTPKPAIPKLAVTKRAPRVSVRMVKTTKHQSI